MSVTIKDVARLAGVSVATVSRVLNASAPVQADTRARVLQVARELRFAPNGAARTLSRRRAGALGVILPDLYGEFFSELLRGIDQEAQRAGHSLLVSSSHHDSRGVAAAIRAMRGRVDGLLVMAPEIPAEALDSALPDGLPVVLLNRAPGVAAASVMVDNYGGAHEMTRHLLSLGHRRIGFLAGAANNADSDERQRGFLDALREAGVQHDRGLCARGDFAEEGGWRGARALLALATPPSVIFAANDAMAVGALSALREAGIDVPADMGVVGFDDIPVARFLHPPLTSVRVGIAALGERGASLLLSTITERPPPPGAPRRDVLPTELVVRASCGALAVTSRSPISVSTPS
ncbi:MAG: LacI family DNA-binding transcriptional regulator [Gemmatimonadaceae bacterium]